MTSGDITVAYEILGRAEDDSVRGFVIAGRLAALNKMLKRPLGMEGTVAYEILGRAEDDSVRGFVIAGRLAALNKILKRPLGMEGTVAYEILGRAEDDSRKRTTGGNQISVIRLHEPTNPQFKTISFKPFTLSHKLVLWQ